MKTDFIFTVFIQLEDGFSKIIIALSLEQLATCVLDNTRIIENEWALIKVWTQLFVFSDKIMIHSSKDQLIILY